MNYNEAGLVEIYLADPLDEPRGFCFDIRGYKESADIKKVFKRIPVTPTKEVLLLIKERFSVEKISVGEFYIPNFEVCMEAENTNPPSALKLESCSEVVYKNLF